VNASERFQLLREVELSGNCSHPIRLQGEMTNLATGEVGVSSLRITCKDRRHVICPSCSYTYKADAWILVSSGLVGGKGTPDVVGGHPRLFITLTAPSFGSVHTVKVHGGCVAHSRPHNGPASGTRCPHGGPRSCVVRHGPGDPQLGRPLCEECFDYVGAILWNAHASSLWNNTIQLIRRSIAETAGVGQRNLKTVAQVQYLKVAEMQRRGLMHFHVILRVDGPREIDEPPPSWLTPELLGKVVHQSVRRAIVPSTLDRAFQWGQLLDVQDLGTESGDASAVASYIAKYVTKTTDGSTELARRFKNRRQIGVLVDDPHLRRLATTSWTLDLRPELEPLRLRDHAHTFGFTGQPITKSRHYSTTFSALRQARADYMMGQNVGDPVEGTFHYEGRGYDDPRGTEMAEMFFRMQRELRIENAEARRAASSSDVDEPS
jgi:hypothetical protein